MEITRISAPAYNKTRTIERLLWTFRINFQLIRALLAHSASPKADVVFTGAPPFMLFFAISLKILRKVRLIYRITDFSPKSSLQSWGSGLFFFARSSMSHGFCGGAWMPSRRWAKTNDEFSSVAAFRQTG